MVLDSPQQSAVVDEQRMTETQTVQKTHAEEAMEEKALSAIAASYNGDVAMDDDASPIEQVALTVPTTDDPSLQVWTFRMWSLGLVSCAVLSFLNQFFAYRREPLIITLITVQIVALPIGRFMAATLPTRKFKVPLTNWEWSLNPGPFNLKEHVLITIFANAGSAFSNGNAYAVGIITITKAFYKRKIDLIPSILLVITTQVLGYGWAGMMRGYLVSSAYMWWPANLVQVSLFRTLHEEEKKKGCLTRNQFFVIFMIVSFSYYVLPGYLFGMLTSLSWVCWAWPKSVTAQQLGSGLSGLGVGAFAIDWSTIAAFLLSPLVSPFFAIVNVFVGFVIVCYIVVPAAYWSNAYHAKTFPIFSSNLFTVTGQPYNISGIVNSKFRLDLNAYEAQGPINLSTFFAVTYGFGFAAVAATVSHVMCFNGKQIWRQTRAALKEKPDVHARLMQRYPDIPYWWFLILDCLTIGVAIATCEAWKDQLQLPWWGVLFACALACFFTLPIGVITATTNQTPGLNIITEYIMGYMLPGRPIANVCFKTYGYISMTQAVSFLSDFKLGHYMKIPPRSMFIIQVVGTVLAAVVNVGVAWWLLATIHNICDAALLPPSSPWTCPGDRVFFDASIIWGLVGPKRIFGSMGEYSAINWFFLGGFLAPVLVWLLHKAFPRVSWIPLINMPVLLGATAHMPPATPINYTSWIIVGTIFNFFVFRYRKSWWQRYNYVLSAAMDAGLAFMAVFLYFTLGLENRTISWWGNNVDNCPLASCPTEPGIVVDGCPIF